ncbi:hypothetical protein TWF281_005992 [Arthrobotrys megalospora]
MRPRDVIAFMFFLLMGILTVPMEGKAVENPQDSTTTAEHLSLMQDHTTSKTSKILKRVVGGQDNDPELLELFKNATTAGKKSQSRGDVSSNIFFKWTMICPSHWQITGMEKDPNAYPVIGGTKRPNIDEMLKPGDFSWIKRKQCMNCLCSDDGDIIVNPSPQRPINYWCKTITTPPKCRLWYGSYLFVPGLVHTNGGSSYTNSEFSSPGCRCSAEMLQPAIEIGNSITDYQNALNNIPMGIKLAHRGYEWNLAEKFSMSWQYLAREQGGSTTNTRELVPGTKEPYYLEGPDPKPRDWEQTLGNPLFGGSGSVWKSKRSVDEESD